MAAVQNKQFLIGFAVILIIIIYLLYRNKNKNTGNNMMGGLVVNPPIKNTDNSKFPLKIGSKGDEVRIFQTYLRTLDHAALPQYGIDGDFGPETQSESQRLIGMTQIDYNYYKNVVLPAYAIVVAAVGNANGFGFRRR